MRRHEKDTRCKWNMTYCGFSPRPLHSLYSAFEYHRPVTGPSMNATEAKLVSSTGFPHGHIASPDAWREVGITPSGEKLVFGHFGYLKVIFLNLLNFSSTLRGTRANYHLKRRRFVPFPRTNDLKHSFFLKQSVGHLLLVLVY